MRNARVFISCGQRNAREIEIGKAVEDYFINKGFATYFAERVHSSDALTENIFKFLKQSEYLVFINFRREKINKDEYRGSLFVNQEIAIATFLKLEGIGFNEKGIKREGILSYHIYNEFIFENKDDILKELDEATKNWNINSVNELIMIYDPNHTSKGYILQNHPHRPLSDWYHLEVVNRHSKKHAFSCLGYVTKIKDLNTGENLEIPTIELKWSGINDIYATILAGTRRELDAFHVLHSDNQIRFTQRNITTTNPRYRLPFLSNGKYLVEYTIISSNFEKVSQCYIIEHKGSFDDVIFKEAN
ncbi:MAG: hypothetical protein ACTSQY_05905 [Candidatus Odinarchaeia archaeon]